VNEAKGGARTQVDVVDLCRGLIALPSENPSGGETAVAAKVADLLSVAGFEIGWHEAVRNRPNVVARLRRGNGRRLILQAHADTKPAVAPGATSLWTTGPFSAEERAGLLYGLGACDTKGGLAAQLVAACALTDDPSWSGELVVQAVADEEDGSRLGAEHLLALGLLDADGAIVSEPTGCAPSLAQLGNAWAEITIGGRAAHAGTPGRGHDAFRAALRYVAELEAILRGTETDPEFPGHPRLNVGDFAMPGHPGTVPGQCRLRCDIRVLPGSERDATFGLYEKAAEALRTRSNVTVAVTRYQGGGCQSHRIDADHLLAQAFRLAQAETGQPASATSFAGGTDARYFASAGTPAVVYGPGSLEQAHAPDEYVPVAELRLAEQQIRVASLAFLRA
jgi:acetylornithine deacetylase/succinyl-diaminopimelate desuccinylase family protein